MIRVSVDTEEELKIVRDYFVKPSYCDQLSEDQCESMLNCKECAKALAHRFIEVSKRKVIDEPQELVL